jgi:LuxR family maltose regulon positive regulatory protein
MPVVSFAAPPPRPRVLRRPRLLGQLHTALDRPMTLVAAPPGTGKTTLVADWVNGGRGFGSLWFNLDGRADQPDLLCSDLAEQLAPLCNGAARRGARAGVGNRLAEQLARCGPNGDHVVVLDDAQELTSRPVWDELSRLAAASPEWLHWVVVTRADPPLRLQRLLLQGRMAQLRVADLAFDVDEAAALMNWFGLDLPLEALRRLVRWSEGWAAALCLAARAMAPEDPGSRPWEHLGASEAMALELLVEEVLDRLNPADRRFLLHTSVADVIVPDLAKALTGNQGAADQLRRLARAGTFLLDVDADGSRYRYHALMATLLRAKFHDEAPTDAQAVTAAAADWYRRHGHADDAERHAIRAGDWTLVGQVRAARCVRTLVESGVINANHGATVPPSATEHDPALQLLAAMDAIGRGDRRTVERLPIDRAAGNGDPLDPTVVMLGEVVAIERDRLLPPGAGRDPASRGLPVDDDVAESALRSYLDLREAELLLAAGCADVRERLDQLTRGEEVAEWTRAEAEALLAVLGVANGDPSLARTLRARLDEGRWRQTTVWLHVAAAAAHSLRGERAGLVECAERIARDDRRHSSWLADQCARVVIAAAALRPPYSTPTLAPPPVGVPTSMAITLGIVEVVDHAGRTEVVGGPLEASIAAGRRALADGSTRRLGDSLAPWRDGLPGGGHPRSLVELHVLVAIDHLLHERNDLAHRWLERAIDLATPHGTWAPLIARRDELQRLFDLHGGELNSRHPALVEAMDGARASPRRPITALTGRECAVLHYLPTLMSNEEIAAELGVSVNTVKTHLKTIYRKLGVTRRRDALLLARQFELL